MSDIKTERIRKQEERKQRFKSSMEKIRATIDEQKLPAGFQAEMETVINQTLEKIMNELSAFPNREDKIAEWEEIKKRMQFVHIKVSPLMDYSNADRLANISPKQAKQLGVQYLGECATIIYIDRVFEIGKVKPKTTAKSNASVYVKEEFVKNLADGLKGHFDDGKKDELKQLLTGKELSTTLIFNGYSSTLLFTLKTAFESKWFFCLSKNDFIGWICKSFQYASTGKAPRPFTKGQVSNFIYSAASSIPKSRRIEVIGLSYDKKKR